MRRPRIRPFNRDAFIRDSRPRLKKALIAGIAAFLVIALVEGPTLTLVLALLIGLALYVPAWRHVSLGKYSTPSTSPTCSRSRSSEGFRRSTPP